MRLFARLLPAVALVIGTLQVSHANIVQLNSPTELSPGIPILDYSKIGPSFSIAYSGSGFLELGTTILLGTTNGPDLERRDQGNGWNGSFPDGTPLLWTRGSNGELQITFKAAISEFGFLAQDQFNNTPLSVTIYNFANGGTAFPLQTYNGVMFNGATQFLGARASGGDLFT